LLLKLLASCRQKACNHKPNHGSTRFQVDVHQCMNRASYNARTSEMTIAIAIRRHHFCLIVSQLHILVVCCTIHWHFEWIVRNFDDCRILITILKAIAFDVVVIQNRIHLLVCFIRDAINHLSAYNTQSCISLLR
jgi:hypothetical protein